MVEAQRGGKVQSLGVPNYGVHHLEELEAYIAELEAELGEGQGGEISVGQWELHPWLVRPDIARSVVVEAYSPLIRDRRAGEAVLRPLVGKYGKTWAQVLGRWSLQKGFITLPKSITPSRVESNADVYDFELTDEEIASLETGEYAPLVWDPTVSPLNQ